MANQENQRPTGRKRNITGQGNSIHRRGEGLNTGPVGNARPQQNQSGPTQQIYETNRPNSHRNVRRGGGAVTLIAIIAALLFGGNSLFGGSDTGYDSGYYSTPAPTVSVSSPRPTATPRPTTTPKPTATPKPTSNSSINYGISPESYQSITAASETQITHTDMQNVDNTTVSGAREKRTLIRGDGRDQVTVMIYMCGTDLESRSSMATKDLVEMTKASYSDNVRVIVYTGGCTRWNNSVVSSDRNQIYEIKNGGLNRLAADMGNTSMTNPDTLSAFIKWCAQRYPANRNELILWDHGGGSVSGFGYDEKYSRTGSMSLAGIQKALQDGEVKFDFIGFDACLMATLETGLMLDNFADYMIASEETEPGIGWYYTNWLTKLSKNPAMPTVEIGKNIVDDFVATCASQTRGQSATLSVTDLAELSYSVPDTLKSFAQSLSKLIKNEKYQQVSSARNGTREFAQSTAIDQIDLVHFTKRLGTEEGKKLASAIQGAVKYNRTSANMSDAYGLSIYFPYRKTNKVDAACTTYNAIGMDDSYSQCIRAFASLELSGQAASGAGSYGLPSILTGGYPSSSAGDFDMISSLLEAFLSGGGMDYGFYSSGRALSEEDTVTYIRDNSFDATNLYWQPNADGNEVIALPEDQWALISGLGLNLFYDDGKGYIDFGVDAIMEFDDNGNLLAPAENAWLAINNQPVAFYHELTLGSGTEMLIRGYVPALLNGERVELLLEYSAESDTWEITGLRRVYENGETETIAKNDLPIGAEGGEKADWAAAAETPYWNPGDQIEFIADYYTYDNAYQNTYRISSPMTIERDMRVSDVLLDEGNLRYSYRFTDIYQNDYWTPAIFR